jgi:hypothetical protein
VAAEAMTTLHTSSYRAFRPEMGQPLVTSLGLPRWRPESQEWPRCWLLTPSPDLFREDDPEAFTAAYLARLDRFGVRRISGLLERIAREHGADRLVLLCHEADPMVCHRSLFAAWIESTGEQVTELM